MRHCPECSSDLEVTGFHCPACRVSLSGRFLLPRLARLEAADLNLAEQLLLAGGNLTLVAGEQAVSYPTLRKRVDRLIERLQMLRQADERRQMELLENIERSEMTPEQAARLIREADGGA